MDEARRSTESDQESQGAPLSPKERKRTGNSGNKVGRAASKPPQKCRAGTDRQSGPQERENSECSPDDPILPVHEDGGPDPSQTKKSKREPYRSSGRQGSAVKITKKHQKGSISKQDKNKTYTTTRSSSEKEKDRMKAKGTEDPKKDEGGRQPKRRRQPKGWSAGRGRGDEDSDEDYSSSSSYSDDSSSSGDLSQESDGRLWEAHWEKNGTGVSPSSDLQSADVSGRKLAKPGGSPDGVCEKSGDDGPLFSFHLPKRPYDESKLIDQVQRLAKIRSIISELQEHEKEVMNVIDALETETVLQEESDTKVRKRRRRAKPSHDHANPASPTAAPTGTTASSVDRM